MGKSWLVELELLKKDVDSLQKLYEKSFLPVVAVNNNEEADEILKLILKLSNLSLEVENTAATHLLFIERLVERSNLNYNSCLVENHIKIELELKDLLRSFKGIKQVVYKLLPDNQD